MRRVLLALAIGVVGCGGGCGGGSKGGSGGDGSGSTSGAAGATGSGGQVAGASGGALFTPDDVWNADVSGKAVDTTNTAKMNALIGAVNIHPDFGVGFGLPINVVP